MIRAVGALRRAGLDLKSHLFYTDTDSLIVSLKAAEVLREANLRSQNILGKFKDEHPEDPIVEAQFIAPKVYHFTTAAGHFVGKYKGVRAS